MGFEASQSFLASGKLVARNGTTSMPKIGLSFSRIEIRIFAGLRLPGRDRALDFRPLEQRAPPWTVIVSFPPVASATSLAKALRFSTCGLSFG